MTEYSRSRRVADQIQRELGPLIQTQVRDPRVGMATVSAVEVSRDLTHAKVFITTLSPDQDMAATLAGLKQASGFLRRELGRRMKLRVVPELRFVHDESIDRGRRLSSLIEDAVAKDRQNSDPNSDD